MPETEEKTKETTEQSTDLSSDIGKLVLDDVKMGNEETSEVIPEEQPKETDSPTEEVQDNSEEQTTDGGTSEEQAEATTSAEEVQKEETTEEDEDTYLELSEETGIEVSSFEDVAASLKELSELRKNGSHPELSKAILSAIDVEKAGGNLAEHFSRVGMNFDEMDGKEALRQKFFKDNAKLHGSKPKLAQMQFDKEFNSKYGKWGRYSNLSSEDKEDFVEENGQDNIDYEKLMLENDISEAKSELNAWKEENTPVATETKVEGMTAEEQTVFAEQYKVSAQKALDEFEAVAIPMGEGADDYSLALNDKTRELVEQWVDDPATFLSGIGIDKEIDLDRLLPIMTLIAEASVGTLGERISQHAIDSEDSETLSTKITKPSKTTSAAIPPEVVATDDWGLIGEAAMKAAEEATGGH